MAYFRLILVVCMAHLVAVALGYQPLKTAKKPLLKPNNIVKSSNNSLIRSIICPPIRPLIHVLSCVGVSHTAAVAGSTNAGNIVAKVFI